LHLFVTGVVTVLFVAGFAVVVHRFFLASIAVVVWCLVLFVISCLLFIICYLVVFY